MGVKFISVKLKSTFLAIEYKNPFTLYWIEETKELYKGAILFGTGALASELAAGLLSADDYAKLQDLIKSGFGLNNLGAVDSTLVITRDGDNTKIGIGLSATAGNMLTIKDDGLYAAETKAPEYAIEKVATESGFSASYKLKRTLGEDSDYVGDTINIAKDLVLQAATLETVTEDGVPYDDAKVGDPYIKMVFNNADASNLYVPVKGLVDTYTAGDGITIIDNKISVKLADTSHGLVSVNGALALNLATKDSDGAMSKEDKRILDAIPNVYIARKYEVVHKPEGTIVDYREKEIRIMCPEYTEWTHQNSGANADENSYYIGFKAYAPKGAVSFKEDTAEIIADNKMYYFENNEFAGIDSYGRRYSVIWLPVAKRNDGIWTYYGANSTKTKYVGWYYTVEWYSETGKLISTETIRINLSNEGCHNNINSFYGVENDLATAVAKVKDKVDILEESCVWSDM